jgi:hypothetical protein
MPRNRSISVSAKVLQPQTRTPPRPKPRKELDATEQKLPGAAAPHYFVWGAEAPAIPSSPRGAENEPC